jgi:dTDP-L-rhamnose 4-epimerase
MRVLLTGGAGFIGRAVRAELQAAGHEMRILDSMRPDVHGPRTAAQRGVSVVDVRDPAGLDAALVDIDAVVHLAAKVGLGVDLQDVPDYADSNVHGTAVLLAAMERAHVGRLVLASSMVVYGDGLGACAEHGAVTPDPRIESDLGAGRFDAHCPRCGRTLQALTVAEDAPLDPRSAYAVSKLAQEQLAACWARTTGGSLAVLRYHNVYGPGLPRNTPYAGVAAIFLSALRRGQSPRVFEDGGQLRDFVHVGDVAAATVAALSLAGPGVVTLNVGSGQPRTVGELAGVLATVTGGPAPVITGEYRLGDVRHITADSSKLRALLGWRPRVEFERGIAELAHD